MNATFEEVTSIKTPIATSTWEPIPHLSLIQSVKDVINDFDAEITRESYGMSHEGNRMFGVLDFTSPDTNLGYSIALRNSHDKKFSAGVSAGQRVFICDNLILSGDFVLKKKHTKNHEFLNSIKNSNLSLTSQVKNLTDKLNALREQELTLNEARLLVFKAYEESAISSSKMGLVWEEFLLPTYGQFKASTKFNLLMAFTEVAKAEGSFLQLSKMYKNLAPVLGFELPLAKAE